MREDMSELFRRDRSLSRVSLSSLGTISDSDSDSNLLQINLSPMSSDTNSPERDNGNVEDSSDDDDVMLGAMEFTHLLAQLLVPGEPGRRRMRRRRRRNADQNAAAQNGTEQNNTEMSTSDAATSTTAGPSNSSDANPSTLRSSSRDRSPVPSTSGLQNDVRQSTVSQSRHSATQTEAEVDNATQTETELDSATQTETEVDNTTQTETGLESAQQSDAELDTTAEPGSEQFSIEQSNTTEQQYTVRQRTESSSTTASFAQPSTSQLGQAEEMPESGNENLTPERPRAEHSSSGQQSIVVSDAIEPNAAPQNNNQQRNDQPNNSNYTNRRSRSRRTITQGNFSRAINAGENNTERTNHDGQENHSTQQLNDTDQSNAIDQNMVNLLNNTQNNLQRSISNRPLNNMAEVDHHHSIDLNGSVLPETIIGDRMLDLVIDETVENRRTIESSPEIQETSNQQNQFNAQNQVQLNQQHEDKVVLENNQDIIVLPNDPEQNSLNNIQENITQSIDREQTENIPESNNQENIPVRISQEFVSENFPESFNQGSVLEVTLQNIPIIFANIEDRVVEQYPDKIIQENIQEKMVVENNTDFFSLNIDDSMVVENISEERVIAENITSAGIMYEGHVIETYSIHNPIEVETLDDTKISNIVGETVEVHILEEDLVDVVAIDNMSSDDNMYIENDIEVLTTFELDSGIVITNQGNSLDKDTIDYNASENNYNEDTEDEQNVSEDHYSEQDDEYIDIDENTTEDNINESNNQETSTDDESIACSTPIRPSALYDLSPESPAPGTPQPPSPHQPCPCLDQDSTSEREQSEHSSHENSSSSESENESGDSDDVVGPPPTAFEATNGLAYTWDVAARLPVLPVSCRNIPAQLHKRRFGSGSRGRCIRHGNRWYTPNEFQYVCGRGAVGDWRRSITFGNRPLQIIMDQGLLNAHPLNCTCPVCVNGDSAPVRYFRPGKRRRMQMSAVERRRAKRYCPSTEQMSAAPTATVTSANAGGEHPIVHSRVLQPVVRRESVLQNLNLSTQPLPPYSPPRPGQRRPFSVLNAIRSNASQNGVVSLYDLQFHSREQRLFNNDQRHLNIRDHHTMVNNAIAEVANSISNATSRIVLMERNQEKKPEKQTESKPRPAELAVISLYVVRSEEVRKCFCCNLDTPNVCGMCRRAPYCTDFCQQKDWQSHEHECQVNEEPQGASSSMTLSPEE